MALRATGEVAPFDNELVPSGESRHLADPSVSRAWRRLHGLRIERQDAPLDHLLHYGLHEPIGRLYRAKDQIDGLLHAISKHDDLCAVVTQTARSDIVIEIFGTLAVHGEYDIAVLNTGRLGDAAWEATPDWNTFQNGRELSEFSTVLHFLMGSEWVVNTDGGSVRGDSGMRSVKQPSNTSAMTPASCAADS